MRKVVWERGAWLSVKRWGVSEIVVNAEHSRAESQLWRRLEKNGKEKCGENYSIEHQAPANLT